MSNQTLESTSITNKGKVGMSFTLTQLKQIASVGVFAGRERDTYTPALSVIAVQIALGTITAVATDRYCVAKLELVTEMDVLAGFYLSPEAVKVITGIKAQRGDYHLASVEIEDNRLTISYNGTTYTEAMFTGNYPAVQNLWDNLTEGPVTELALKPDFIGKLSKLIGDDGKKLDGAWRFKFHADPESKKPKPVLATNSCYEVLIQPALLPN